MTDNDNKNKLTGKFQLKKTINAGQIKQSFSHGRSRSVSVEVKKKRSISGFSKNEKVEQPKSPDTSLTEPEKIKKEEMLKRRKNVQIIWKIFGNLLNIQEILGKS